MSKKDKTCTMSGREMSSRINYTRPCEPSFLTKFKQQAGYKEGPSVETKKEVPMFEDEVDDRPETEDEKPAVVVLRDGDLTQAEAEEFMRKQNQDEGPPPQDEKIMFKKPVKRQSKQGTDSDLNISSTKKKKEQPSKKELGGRKDEGKKVKNASLLSFDEDDEEGT